MWPNAIGDKVGLIRLENLVFFIQNAIAYKQIWLHFT